MRLLAPALVRSQALAALSPASARLRFAIDVPSVDLPLHAASLALA